MMSLPSISGRLYDYGKVHSGPDRYAVANPECTGALAEIVRFAHENRRAVRIRGSGHTFSGMSLPRSDEILVRTSRLDRYRFESDGTLTVGAGALVWDVRDLLRDHALDLPVYNGGWAGPTVGGYINAGGIGKGNLSDLHGGFWENVEEVSVLNGRGELLALHKTHEDFPWLFGGWGQLGVIAEARLRVIPLEGSAPLPFPVGKCGRVPRRQTEDPRQNDLAPGNIPTKRLFWFSVFCEPHREPEVWDMLSLFVEAHPDMVPTGGWAGPEKNGETIGYHYIVRFHHFHPPLVYPQPETFLVLGVMAFLESGTPARNARLRVIEREFLRRARERKLLLYPQAENFGRQLDLESIYDQATWQRFRELRAKFDPRDVINPGFFPETPSTPNSGPGLWHAPEAEPPCVVFLGPSLPVDEARAILPTARFLPPARMGDIYRLVGSDVRRVVLIDGLFHAVPSVWQREILAAIESGIEVIGASSMGALRAAELHTEGMLGIGQIFEWFRDGILDGDDEVTLLHGDESDGYPALSEALVNFRDHFSEAVAYGILSQSESQTLIFALKRMPFFERHFASMWQTEAGGVIPRERQMRVEAFCKRRVSLKQRDARAALECVAGRQPPTPNGPSLAAPRPSFPEDSYAATGLSKRGFRRSDGTIIDGNELFPQISQGDLAARLRRLIIRQYFLMWLREAGIACPPEHVSTTRNRWKTGFDGLAESEILQRNGMTDFELDEEIGRRAAEDWIRSGNIDSLVPGLQRSLSNGDEQAGARERLILADWARRVGVEAPPDGRHGESDPTTESVDSARRLTEWMIDRTPTFFGEPWDPGIALLREAQCSGELAAVLNEMRK